MSDNKFIKHLRGENTAKSVLEIKNQRTTTSFANMPDGNTSNANDVYSDHRGNATGVLKGTENWKLDGQNLVETTTVYGDGRDFTDSFSAFGNGLWVNATCTFATARRFSPNTKFVLKLCGHDLETVINHTVDFTLIVKFGASNLISKTFTVTEQAFDFCKEFVIDFAESNSSTIKADAGSTMQVQLLCADPAAQAVLYNGMTVFTALQRRVDADAVASDTKTFDEVVDDIVQIQEDLDDLEEYVDDTFVKKAGDTMSGTLNIIDPNGTGTNTVLKLGNGSTTARQWNFAPSSSTQSMSVYPGTVETNGYRFVSTGFCPASNNARYLGASNLKWRAVYTGEINNGSSITVPNKSGTMALMSDVELAANSGTQLYTTGVWYAQMYQGSTIPAWAEVEGRLLADFSQREKERPIIVIYEYHNGQWEQIDSFFPPEQYNGYITVTSKILDIQEQSGQQGGQVLWSFDKQTFTPYPRIVSFEDAALTGNSTVTMPLNPTGDAIVNKNYVDNKISNSIGNSTITLTQGGQTMGSFTTNQSSDATIALDGGSSYHPDLFDWKWADHQLNDVQWLRADTFSWQDGGVYEAAFNELFYDIQVSTYWYRSGSPAYTKSRTPEAGDAVYLNSDLTTQIGTVEAYDDVNDAITISGDTYTFMSNTYVTPTTETVAGYSVSVYTGHSGRKIVAAGDETNVANIYATTGVAWYYIIDIPNKRFKLPRTQYGVTGLRDTVGNYVEAGLPNITGSFLPYNNRGAIFENSGSVSGAFKRGNSVTGTPQTSGSGNGQALDFDASLSSSIYGNSNTVQPPATQMYLYFYVGEFTQTALENTAGINTEIINDFSAHRIIDFQAPTAGNNYTWYRKYADGWVEQGGTAVLPQQAASTSATASATLPITMADGNYTVSWAQLSDAGNSHELTQVSVNRNTTNVGITFYSLAATNGGNVISWEIKGMAA